MIGKVIIENYRSFGDRTEVKLRKFNVLVGPNNSGKSNFLDFLSFISDLVKTRISDALRRRGGYRAVVFNGEEDRDIRFSIEAELNGRPLKYKVVIGGEELLEEELEVEGKVLIKQTAASIWNYDFVPRSVYRLAVRDEGYRKALEALGRRRGWAFEIEVHDRVPYEYVKLGGLLIESVESSIVSCVAEWSFLDALATLYFRRGEVNFGKLKKMARWRRLSRSDVRVWQVIRYGCSLFNERLGRKLFKVRKASLDVDIRELVDEAVDKVIEFA